MARYRRYMMDTHTGRTAIEMGQAAKKENAGKWYVCDHHNIGEAQLFDSQELALVEYKRRKAIFMERER